MRSRIETRLLSPTLSSILNGGEGVTLFLASQGIEELRFCNQQWKRNCEGVLLEIWSALHRSTGCVAIMRKGHNHRYVPPNVEQLTRKFHGLDAQSH